jgi:hypothetical protein
VTVTVTDRRSVLAYADSTSETQDAGPGTWNTGTAHTATFAEATGCIAVAINETTGQIYFGLTSANISLTDTLIYVQTQVIATQTSWTNGVHSLYLSDGTNAIAFHYSGNDRRQFSHDKDGPVGWQCFVLDGSLAATKNTAGETTVLTGTWANFISNIGSITDVGAYFDNLSKALGGGVNSYVDVIRYGNDGIRITAGGSGTEGNFSEIVAEDKSTANLKAHGILRQYTTGIFGCQGPMTFGDSGTATTSYFADSGVVIAFENRDIDDDKYYLAVEGNSGATNSFVLSSSTISTAGPLVTCNFNAGNVNTLTLDTVVFSRLGNAITFSNSSDATGHTISNCTFDGCGQIDPGDVTFSDNIISDSTAYATGALLLDADGSSNLSGLHFISGVTEGGHAIYIPSGATGTYTLTNFTYDDYGSTGTVDAVIYNNSGGSVTIEVSGGDTPTYRNGSGASTTVNSTKTLTITAVDADAVAIPYAKVRVENSSTGALIADGIANNLGVFVYSSYNYVTDEEVDVIVRKNSPGEVRYLPVRQPATIDDNGLTLTVQLAEDTICGSPPAVGILRQGITSEDESGNAIITAEVDVPDGTSRKLLVGALYWDSTANLTVSAATYDGSAMTNVAGGSAVEQEGAGNYHEIALYYYDVPDADTGRKTISITWSANVAIKGIAFAFVDDAATGAVDNSSTNTGDQVTSNPSVTLNNTAAGWSIIFLMVDDTDSPSATGVATIRRSDLVVDELKMMAVLTAKRTTTGSHNLGADYGSDSKTWVAGGATVATN